MVELKKAKYLGGYYKLAEAKDGKLSLDEKELSFRYGFGGGKGFSIPMKQVMDMRINMMTEEQMKTSLGRFLLVGVWSFFWKKKKKSTYRS